MRIAFVIPSLGPGGAERIASLLCSCWAQQGHDVTLVTFAPKEGEPFFDLDPTINLHSISTTNRTRSPLEIVRTNILRVQRLRELICQLTPEIVVAFMTEANVISLVATRGLGTKTVISERNQLNRPGLGGVRSLACRLVYRWASVLVVQTDEIAAVARSRFATPVHVLPNPVPCAPKPDSDEKGKRAENEIIAAGRLVPQKGFDLLIESFGRVAPEYPEWSLTIYGEGPERQRLKSAIRGLRLSETIRLPGLCRDLGAALRRASLFVLPSRFEGFPNVLLEALACGCPVIATDCPGGTRQILDGGRYGVLVSTEDVSGLAAAIGTMIQSPAERDALAATGFEAVKRFALPTIAQRWIDLFASLRNSPHKA